MINIFIITNKKKIKRGGKYLKKLEISSMGINKNEITAIFPSPPPIKFIEKRNKQKINTKRTDISFKKT
jgi:hypothetical protein